MGECFNNAVNIANGDYIAKMDDDDYYGEYYILDAINAFKYSGADIIGKNIYLYTLKRKIAHMRSIKAQAINI